MRGFDGMRGHEIMMNQDEDTAISTAAITLNPLAQDSSKKSRPSRPSLKP